LPDGFEDLVKLETLVMNDNRVRRLPARIGMLKKLKKLFLHNNLIAQLPSELACLEHLREFSLEWFMYMLPPMPKVLRESKGQAVIDRIKQFCRTAQQCSFSEFVIYFHQIPVNEVNKVIFGPKKRTLVHQICINAHPHLLQDLMSKRS
jgi:hypothetical protein